ncbi:MAG: hypothetical protein VX519_04440 [Myxococcota bacterium]|nr:hypothetical protein [Myxococcota bacterium]
MQFVILLGFLGCGLGAGSGLTESQVEIQTPHFTGVEHRFLSSANPEMLPPENVAIVRELCPRIVEAVYTPDHGELGQLRLVGEHLERVVSLSVQDGTGRLLEAVVHRESDESLRFGLQCRTCRLVPGFRFGDRVLGCLGPGYSLRLREGQLRAD